MPESLNTSAQSQIKAVDAALKNYINQAQSGKNDISDLFGIEKQLIALAKNPKIPDQVRQSLQTALNELKQIQSGEVNLSNLYSAKTLLDSALHSGGAEEMKSEDVKKMEGGSLGGGGGAQE